MGLDGQDRDEGPRANVVAVFGSADPREGDPQYVTAHAVGRALAELGYSIVNGGYGGTMEASARGASEGGAEVFGVTCAVWRSRPNRYVAREIRTASLPQRVSSLIERGTGGYVCLPGSTGTLVELANVWEMLFKGLLARRPLVCVGPFWQGLIDTMVSARARSAEFIARVDSPEDLRRHFPAVPGRIACLKRPASPLQ